MSDFFDQLHAEKYRASGETFREAMNRVANATKDSTEHFNEWRHILLGRRFMPAGRIQAAMGSARTVTPINCFVSPTIQDSFVDGENSIMDVARKAAATMRMGGGIGYDFSTLRPKGALIKKLASQSTGPLSFMEIYDSICRCVASAGHRRGAQMGILRVDHPDIVDFIHAKQNSDRLTGFNLSIAITDKFMVAVVGDLPFMLRWRGKDYGEVNARNLWEMIMRSTWDWAEPGVIFIDQMNAMNNLWYAESIAACNPCFTGDTEVISRIGRVALKHAVGTEIEVLTETSDGLIDYRRMYNIRRTKENAQLVSVQFETGSPIRCTPEHEFFMWTGEKKKAKDLRHGDKLVSIQPGGRMVEAVNVLFGKEDVYCGTVDDPTHRFFVSTGENDGVLVANCGEQALGPNGACLLGSFNLTQYLSGGDWDLSLLKQDIPHVVRAMDNVIDSAMYPLPEQRQAHINSRRMGLGITGLANAIECMGHPYGTPGFLTKMHEVMSVIRDHAYAASCHLAAEKGSFPLYDKDKYAAGNFIRTLPEWVSELISENGIRNSHLISIAPTGTISLCAGNVSSGIEPVFAHEYRRTLNTADGPRVEDVKDYGVRKWGVYGKQCKDVTATEHLDVLITAQKYTDSAVSKTCNVSPTMDWEDFKSIYIRAWRGGCKGCTTFNIGGKRFGVLETNEDGACKIDLQTGKRNCE